MKILFILNSIGLTGGAQRMCKFVIEKALQDEEILVLSTYKKEQSIVFNKNVTVLYIKNPLIDGDRIIKRIIKRIGSIFSIRKTIKEIHPNKVCLFGLNAGALLGIKKVNDYQLIYCERGDPFSYRFYLKWLLSRCLRKFDKVVFQTPMAATFFPTAISKKGCVIPNPCKVTQEPLIKGNYTSNKLIAIGRLVPEKGFDFIIQVFSKLHCKYSNMVLRIFGDGEEFENLNNLIHSLGLSECCFLLGPTNNVEKEILDSKLLLFASTFEGMPNVVLESSCLGIPCVCTDCSPGGASFITQGGTVGGKISPIGDFDSYYNNLISLLVDEKEYQKFSKSGSLLRGRFDEKKISEQWHNLFCQ